MVATSAETPGLGLSGRVLALSPIFVGLGILLVAFGVAFLPSIQWMAAEWSGSSGALSHGYLVVAISIFLIAKALPDVAALVSRPAWWALPVLLALSIVWLFAYVATVVAVQTIVLPAILLTSIAAAFGLPVARHLAFPILFVYFAIPAWDHLQFIFQAITVFVVGLLIRIVDMPALVVGNLVHLPAGSFHIAGGCSGLNFIVAGLSLAVLYGHLYYDTVRQNLNLIVLTLAVAMLGNWIRVFGVIVIGYQSDMQSSLVNDHLTLGWILFAVLMIPVFVVARKLEDPAGQNNPGKQHACDTARPKVSWLAVVAGIATMIAGPVWAAAIASPITKTDNLVLELPTGGSQWSGPGNSHWDWQPVFAGAAAERVAEYVGAETSVLVYTNLYLTQQQGRELIFIHNRIAGDWRTADSGSAEIALPQIDGKMMFRQLVARNYMGDWLIWYRYEIGGVFETSDTRVKLRQALETLQGRPHAGIVAFATPCHTSCEQASHTLSAFVAQIGHSVHVKIAGDMQ